MIIATPTITHTGTRFLHRRILRSPTHYRVCSMGHQNRGSHGMIFHTHMFNELRDVWQSYLAGGFPIIIPLRHPVRNYQSLKLRKANLPRFNEQWENLIALADKCDPMYLHLDDLEVREKQAFAITQRFQLPTEIDWSAGKTSGATHGTHELAITEELAELIPTGFIEFYNQTRGI